MTRWNRRIARAGELEARYPASAELLRFYRAIARFQRDMELDLEELERMPRDLSLHPARLPEPVRRYCGRLLRLMQEEGPPVLAEAARELMYTDGWDPADPAPRFVARVLMQPYAQLQALDERPSGQRTEQEAARPVCPFCGEKPVAAVLRPEGEGGKRWLLCSLCATEWEFRRLLCPSCGEEDHRKLPVYMAEEFPHVRVEACDTCRVYVKAIDMTKDGLAVPEVDELAAAALDLWAAGHGYAKLQPNLLGL
jgi:FdhE protein